MRFYRPGEHTFGNGTHDSLALAFGVMDDPAEQQRLAASLAWHYRKNGHRFDGGFMSYWIYPMLSRHGYGDDALKMMRNTQCVGPAWAIDRHDATTFWEQHFADPKAQFQRSLNHHAGSHPAAWLLTDLAGIRFDETVPGGSRLILAPAVPVTEKLDHVKASLRTRHGIVESAWRREGGKVIWEFSVPPNAAARLQPPAGAVLETCGRDTPPAPAVASERTVGSGRYRMTWTQENDSAGTTVNDMRQAK
jgi:alpha-L-rhamnosidase